MCLPALRELKECFTKSEITILARPPIADLLRGQWGIAEVLVYDHQKEHQGFLGLLRLVKALRGRTFDTAVLFQNAFEAAFLALIAGIPSRIGYATDGRGWLLSQSVPLPSSSSVHQVRYYQHLVEVMTQVSSKVQGPKLVSLSQLPVAIHSELTDALSESNGLLLGINPGSIYGSAKRWDPERFAIVGDRLVEKVAKAYPKFSAVRCVILGGRGEEILGMKIASYMRSRPIVLSGQTTIPDLMKVLTQCAVLVTNDTGPMHMAQALGVPVVAIFGSTDPTVTGPFGENAWVIREQVRCSPCLLRACPIDHHCMTAISVNQVVETVMARMDHILTIHHMKQTVN